MAEDDLSLTNMKVLMTLIGEIYYDRLKELATGKLEGSVGEEEFMESKEKIKNSVVFKDIGRILAEARIDFRYNTDWNTVKKKLLGGEKKRKIHGQEKIERVSGFVEMGFVEQDGKLFKISEKGLNRVFGYLLFVEFDRMSNSQ
tara:strand:- start:1 stop:432 length:432 start_codon:yes stop_codon:yes gene_type:complete